MTIAKAITVTVQQDADDDLIGKALMDVQAGEDEPVDPLEEYDPSAHMALVDLASIEVLQCLLSLPDITEGGLSVKYDKVRMMARLDYLQKKQGVFVEEQGATITDISNQW